MVLADEHVECAVVGPLERDLRHAPGTLAPTLDPQERIGLLSFVVGRGRRHVEHLAPSVSVMGSEDICRDWAALLGADCQRPRPTAR